MHFIAVRVALRSPRITDALHTRLESTCNPTPAAAAKPWPITRQQTQLPLCHSLTPDFNFSYSSWQRGHTSSRAPVWLRLRWLRLRRLRLKATFFSSSSFSSGSDSAAAAAAARHLSWLHFVCGICSRNALINHSLNQSINRGLFLRISSPFFALVVCVLFCHF